MPSEYHVGKYVVAIERSGRRMFVYNILTQSGLPYACGVDIAMNERAVLNGIVSRLSKAVGQAETGQIPTFLPTITDRKLANN